MEYLNKGNFDEKVSTGLVLVDFYADWCGPCKMISPVLEQLANEYEGKLSVYKVNVDDEPELAERFAVQAIPNMYLLKDGTAVDHAMGYQTKDKLVALVTKHF